MRAFGKSFSGVYLCRLCVLVALLLVVGCAANRSSLPTYEISTSKGTWDRYEPASLNHLKATLFDYPENQIGMTINAAAAAKPYKISGLYLGESRPVSTVKTEFIQKWWGSTLKIGEEFTNLFESELLFEVEGARYWMPVQRQVLPYFQKELTKGDSVDLYVMVLGTIDNLDEHDWIIIINEFQKKKQIMPAAGSKIGRHPFRWGDHLLKVTHTEGKMVRVPTMACGGSPGAPAEARVRCK